MQWNLEFMLKCTNIEILIFRIVAFNIIIKNQKQWREIKRQKLLNNHVAQSGLMVLRKSLTYNYYQTCHWHTFCLLLQVMQVIDWFYYLLFLRKQLLNLVDLNIIFEPRQKHFWDIAQTFRNWDIFIWKWI